MLIMIWVACPDSLAGADQCDELHDLAMSYVVSAREVYSGDMDYSHAAELFCEAAGYFELIYQRTDCANREVWSNSLEKADYYAERAIEAENIVRYVNAVKLYEGGHEWARGKNWEQAVNSFAKAADLWKTIGALEPDGENGKRALEAARHAEDVIARTRRFQQSLEFGEW